MYKYYIIYKIYMYLHMYKANLEWDRTTFKATKLLEL